MIRPFTCVCLLLAAGSGLYTYQVKHRAALLDRDISQALKQVDATRQRIGVLRAEYALLNDPQRLAELAAAHLPDMRSTEPKQFTTLAELDRRLPPIGLPATPAPPVAEPAETAPPDPAPALAIPMASAPAPAPARVAIAAPVTPILAASPVKAPIPAPKPHVARASQLAQAASGGKPPAPRLAMSRPPASDAYVTPVSASAEALARVAGGGASGVGRSGMGGTGGSTVSSLGMARTDTMLYPAALPAR